VERRLLQRAVQAGVPLAQLLLLAEPDPLWGERLVALVRAAPHPAADPTAAAEALISPMAALAAALPPSQRPRRWLACPELAPSALGKWQRHRWQQWLAARR
jgi:O-succinylbenzoic acid--CoA ligase